MKKCGRFENPGFLHPYGELMKLLIDTDIGDDIDDALALSYALEKGAEIVGVTTVYREAPKRAAIVRKMLHYKGIENIPVKSGYSLPISKEAVIFGKMNYRAPDFETSEDDPEEAVDLIADCVRRYGNDLHILTMGAQTNIAHACRKYPELMKQVGSVSVMGGCFTYQHNEWNIAGDPTAARIVAESGLPLFYVPWNVTKDLALGVENYHRILEYHDDSMSGFVADLVRQWKDRNPNWTCPLLHDPAMLVCVLDRTICKSKETTFCVLDSGPAAGMTIGTDMLNRFALNRLPSCPVTVVESVDPERLVSDFMKTLFD